LKTCLPPTGALTRSTWRRWTAAAFMSACSATNTALRMRTVCPPPNVNSTVPLPRAKTRLIYVKGSDDKNRHPKMLALVRKTGRQLIRRRFIGIADLTSALNASLVDHLVASGGIQTRPFEEQPCPDAALDALDPSIVSAFLRRAREERQFPLAETTAVADVMTHLDLLLDGQPTKAAVLLFGRNPQRYFPSAEVRCMHFHGTEIARPVPFYRIFKGNLFDQVDQAVDFALFQAQSLSRHARRRPAGSRPL